MKQKNINKLMGIWFSPIVILLVIVILFSLLFPLGGLFCPKHDIISNWRLYYKQPDNSIDILIVGSSHAYSTFNPDIIQSELNANAFILASSSQMPYQSYYYAKEVLKKHTPKIIILETFRFTYSGFTSDEGFDYRIEYPLDGMKYCKNKIDFSKTAHGDKNYIKSLFPIIKYRENLFDIQLIKHNFSEIFLDGLEKNNGFRPEKSSMTEATMMQYKNMESVNIKYSISGEQQYYIEKLSDLCAENGIELILVNAPMYDEYLKRTNFDSRYELIKQIADDENLLYIDYIHESNKLGLKGENFGDKFNSWHHLNESGANIVTKDFVEKLKDRNIN